MEIGAEGAARKRRLKEEGVKRQPTACPVTGGLCPADHYLSPQQKHYTMQLLTASQCETCSIGIVLNILDPESKVAFFFILLFLAGCCATPKERKLLKSKWKWYHVSLIQVAVGVWAQKETSVEALCHWTFKFTFFFAISIDSSLPFPTEKVDC